MGGPAGAGGGDGVSTRGCTAGAGVVCWGARVQPAAASSSAQATTRSEGDPDFDGALVMGTHLTEIAGEPSRGKETKQLSPGLYVVGTPIGNLEDITLRAQRVLAAVDLVVCEDTRVTGRLLRHLGIDRPLLSYHEHNAPRVRPAVLARLRRGERIALVCDAGTPTVADPGYRLVREAVASGIAVHAVPGPSAVIAALSVSGLPSDRFCFAGFLPPRGKSRRARIEELARLPATLVLFEAPHRIRAALRDLAGIMGDRDACIARELTKMFEEVAHGRLAELAESWSARERIRGEIVVVVAPPAGPQPAPAAELEALLRNALARSSLREAVAEVAARTGHPRREVYRLALRLRQRPDRP